MTNYAPPPAIIEAARETQQPALMLAISFVESSWRVNARGKAGEIGAMQLHPLYHTVPKTTKEQFKYAENYLLKLRKLCGEYLFLACYNAGPKKVLNSLDKGINMRYTKRVMEAYRGIIAQSTQNRRPFASDQSSIRLSAND